MKNIKRLLSVALCLALICTFFAGCSSAKTEKYSDTTLIIGYTESVAPFLEVNDKGEATGFEADLWNAIFKSIKGDLKDFVFEKVDEDYMLEEDGGFFDEAGKEYSASLLFGAVSKNNGTFNENHSFTEPLITDRVIAITANDSKVKDFASFKNAKVVTVSKIAADTFAKNTAISGDCKDVKAVESLDDAFAMLDDGKADVVITNELTFCPNEKSKNYTVLENELDTIEYVIATAKWSGWKNSINEAVRELKNEKYGDGDEFTPMVEKHFGYNASSFDYITDGDK